MKRRIFRPRERVRLTCTSTASAACPPITSLATCSRKLIPGARNANVFLENGARLYLDTGFHPEYDSGVRRRRRAGDPR